MNGNEASMKMMRLMSNFCMCYTSSVSQKRGERKNGREEERKNGREEERMEERKKERTEEYISWSFSTPNYYILITLTSLCLMSESGE